MKEVASLISLHRSTGIPWDMLTRMTRADRALAAKAAESLLPDDG